MQSMLEIQVVQILLPMMALFAEIFLAGLVIYAVWIAAKRLLRTARNTSMRRRKTPEATVAAPVGAQLAIVETLTPPETPLL
jgi:hypothetical protein